MGTISKDELAKALLEGHTCETCTNECGWNCCFDSSNVGRPLPPERWCNHWEKDIEWTGRVEH